MSDRKHLSRRDVLRGAGVALALPWLESMAPRTARGQAVAPARTFVAMASWPLEFDIEIECVALA